MDVYHSPPNVVPMHHEGATRHLIWPLHYEGDNRHVTERLHMQVDGDERRRERWRRAARGRAIRRKPARENRLCGSPAVHAQRRIGAIDEEGDLVGEGAPKRFKVPAIEPGEETRHELAHRGRSLTVGRSSFLVNHGAPGRYRRWRSSWRLTRDAAWRG